MSGFKAEVDAEAKAAQDEAASGGGDGFPPLSAGKYQATVLKVDGVTDFGGQGGNAKKKVVKIQIKIVPESPTGKNRVFFTRIPLFTRYAPTEKNPKGAPARAYFDFWGKVAGVPDENLLTGDLTITPEQLQGKPLTITLSAPIKPDEYNAKGSNEVSFFDKPGSVNDTPTQKPTVPWLDAEGNLLDGVAPAAPGAPAAAQSATPPSYSPPAAPAAAASSAPPAWGVDPVDQQFADAVAATPVPDNAAGLETTF